VVSREGLPQVDQLPKRMSGKGAMPEHLILYDGVCGLCNRFNQFVLKRDTAGTFQFASLQSDLARSLLAAYGKNPAKLDTLYVIVNYESGSPLLLSKARGALFAVTCLGGFWRLLRVFNILPAPVLDWAYSLVARNRYRLFGRYETCLVPSPELRSRFIDV